MQEEWGALEDLRKKRGRQMKRTEGISRPPEVGRSLAYLSNQKEARDSGSPG